MLVKGADWLVEGASGIAEKAGISKLVIGLTIVAMGTSAPEAAISISASIKGSAAIAVGNVLGSNILNILLILGLTAVITPLAVHESTVKYEIPFVFFVTIIFALIGLRDKTIGRIDGVNEMTSSGTPSRHAGRFSAVRRSTSSGSMPLHVPA